MLPSVHIKNALVADGYTFGGTSAWGIFISKLPPAPARVIGLYDTPGRTPNPKWLLDYPTVQIRVRGGVGDYDVVGNKIIEVRNRLLGKPSYDSSGDRIVSITGLGDASYIGRNENDEPEWVANLSMIIEPAATTGSHREPL